MTQPAAQAEQILASEPSRAAAPAFKVASPGRPRSAAEALPLSWLAWTAVLLPFLLLAVLPHIPGAGLDADDYGQYLMHARALASGHGYGDINYIYTRLNPWIGPAMAPPGLPLLLAPVLALGGAAAVPWFMVALTCLLLVLLGRYVLEHVGRAPALATVLLCGLVPAFVLGAAQPLTDLPFVAVLWGMALVADRPGAPSAVRVLALTALGALALALRFAGVVVIPMLLLLALLRWKQGGWRFAVPPALWGLATVAAAQVIDLRRLLLIRLNPAGLLAMMRPHWLVRKATAYGAGFLDAQLQPFPPGFAAYAYHALATILVLVGAVAWVARRPTSFVTVLALVYGPLLLLLPVADQRYFWPLVPLVLLLLVTGGAVVARRFARYPAARHVAAAALLLLALLGAFSALRRPRPVGIGDTPRGRELFAYLRQLSAREPVRLVFAKPRMLAWELDLPVMGAFSAPRERTTRELCQKGITHVIVSDFVKEGALKRLVTTDAAAFAPVFSNGKYSVFSVRPGGCASLPAAGGRRLQLSRR